MQSITTETTPELNEALETEQVKPRFYQAIGFVEGILEIFDQNSIFKIGESSYHVLVHRKLAETHQTLLPQCFQVYPTTIKGNLSFIVAKRGRSPQSYFVLKGCWEIHNDETVFIIYRNPNPNQKSQKTGRERSILSLNWLDAPPADGRFWELEAVLEGHELIVTKAEGGFDPPPHIFQEEQEEADQVVQSPEIIALLAASPLTTQRIQKMAALVEAQISCKIYELPSYQELPDKQVKFFLTNGNGYILSVTMQPQMFQELAEYNFGQGPALVSGRFGAATATGFKLIYPTVEILENPTPAAEITPIVLKADKPEVVEMENTASDMQNSSKEELSSEKQPIDQAILAVVAKADSPQEPEAKSAKSKKKASKAKK